MKFLILLIPLAFFLRMLMERLNTRNRVLAEDLYYSVETLATRERKEVVPVQTDEVNKAELAYWRNHLEG